jgi:hypothetical protein
MVHNLILNLRTDGTASLSHELFLIIAFGELLIKKVHVRFIFYNLNDTWISNTLPLRPPWNFNALSTFIESGCFSNISYGREIDNKSLFGIRTNRKWRLFVCVYVFAFCKFH